MSRVLTGLMTGLLATAAAGHAAAADWGTSQPPVFKPAFSLEPAPYDDGLDYEFGLRYFYGMGEQRASIGTLDYQGDDSSHFVELHGRIDDRSTSTYVQANLGYAAAIDGTYQTPTSGGTQSTNAGAIAYGGADFGYLPLNSDGFGMGGFIGYQYLNESMYMGRSGFMTEAGGGDSRSNLLEVHGLRLGATARAEVNDMLDFRIDAAAIPYASLSGTYGAFDLASVDPFLTQGNAPQISGHLYGGAIEAMVGFRPHENFAIRGGVRGYYLTGPTETYFEARNPADPEEAQGFTAQGTMELFRWGPVIELTGRF